MLNEGNQIHNLYCVFVRTFEIPFYYGAGTVISYGSGSDFLSLTSYGSGSGKFFKGTDRPDYFCMRVLPPDRSRKGQQPL
jgi:hypothetical protein